ncbi:hypothetical protein [Hydrogenophaga sp.]|uniref:hypothetical protein n=1 Tax=Hydrogenophaga sp. TaxID=1904254 RepID=UPI00344B2253
MFPFGFFSAARSRDSAKCNTRSARHRKAQQIGLELQQQVVDAGTADSNECTFCLKRRCYPLNTLRSWPRIRTVLDSELARAGAAESGFAAGVKAMPIQRKSH